MFWRVILWRGLEVEELTRFKWFLVFQVLFMVGAGLDAVFTWIGINYLGAVEINAGYSPVWAFLFFTFINAVFLGLRPTWRFQLVRVPFVVFAFHAFVRNVVLWLI